MFAFRTNPPERVFHLEDMGIKAGGPQPAFDRESQIAKCVANERLDLHPAEARVVIGDVGRARITKSRVAADLLEFVEQGVELSRIKWVRELTDEVRRANKAGRRIGFPVVIVVGDRERNYSPPHRDEKLSHIRHMAKGWIQARSRGVRHQVSNVPEEMIQTASRMATRLASRR